jgi:hypothetical protein
LEKGERAGGKGKTPFFSPLTPDPEQRRAGAASADGGDGAPGVGGGWGKGKTEGESRGSQPRAHLGPGLLVEAAPRRRAAAGYSGRGGGAWRLREGSEAVVEVRGAQGFFIGAGRSVQCRYFELASSNGRQWWFGKNPGVDSGRRDSQSIRRCVT